MLVLLHLKDGLLIMKRDTCIGFQSDINNTLICYGSKAITGTSNSTATVTYACSFTQEVYPLRVTRMAADGSSDMFFTGIKSSTLTGFTCSVAAKSYGSVFYYHAIGI